MNANIPPLRVWIPLTLLTGGKRDGMEEGFVFAVQSIRARCLQFHVLLKSGAHFRQIPLHYLFTTPQMPARVYSLTDLQLWDCFSYRPVVTVFDFLKGYECRAWLRTKEVVRGDYLFTVDWLPDSDSEAGMLLQPDQNKCAHVLALENGQLAALPTNRVAFADAYFIGNDPHPEKQGYVTLEEVHEAETCDRWSVAHEDAAFYGQEAQA